MAENLVTRCAAMSKKLFALLVGAVALASSVFGQYQPGSPWPKLLGNNLNSSQGLGGGSNGIVRWHSSVSDQFNFAAPNAFGTNGSPVVDANGIVYVASLTGKVYAFNSVGALLWTCLTGDTFGGSIVIGSDGTLYVAGASGSVYAISGGSLGGTVLWSNTLSGDSFTGCPAIGVDGTIYGAGPEGGIFAISGGTSGGTILWSNKLTGDSYPNGPAIGPDGNLYLSGISGAVYAVSGGASGGTVLWQLPVSGAAFFAGPAIDSDGTVYTASATGGIYAVSGGAAGGTLIWSNTAVTDTFFSAPAISSDGHLYLASAQGTIYALSSGPLGGSTLWTYDGVVNAQSYGFFGAAAVGSDDTVYVEGQTRGSGMSPTVPPADGVVFALSANGVFAWATPTPNDGLVGSPAIDQDGTLYVIGDTGGIFALGTPTSIVSLSVSPSPVIGGIRSTGTVTINPPAAAPSGAIVSLTSSSPYVSVPTSVTVPPGALTATFPITTTQPPTPLQCEITGLIQGTTQTGSLQVYADYVTGLSLNPTTVIGGGTSTGTVSVYLPAPPLGYVVNLSSQYPRSVGVPASVTVPGGATTATFTISPNVSSNNFNCDIYASDGTSGAQATLAVKGTSIFGVTLNPSLIGGDQLAVGAVTLTEPAPIGGWVVNLSSEYPSSVIVPASVTVPAGQTGIGFLIIPGQFSNTFVCDIYASDGISGNQARLTVVGDSLAGVSVSPPSVVGGTSATGTVTLTSVAPPGGWTVQLKTQYPATDTVPASIVVPAGSLSANFTITTKATGAAYGCDVYASDGHSGKQTLLMITHS